MKVCYTEDIINHIFTLHVLWMKQNWWQTLYTKLHSKKNCDLNLMRWVSSVQLLSCVCPCETPQTAGRQASLSISEAIQPSHPLSFPFPPAFNLSQHQGFFQWVSSSNQVAKVLELQLQHQSFQWIFRTDFL